MEAPARSMTPRVTAMRCRLSQFAIPSLPRRLTNPGSAAPAFFAGGRVDAAARPQMFFEATTPVPLQLPLERACLNQSKASPGGLPLLRGTDLRRHECMPFESDERGFRLSPLLANSHESTGVLVRRVLPQTSTRSHPHPSIAAIPLKGEPSLPQR